MHDLSFDHQHMDAEQSRLTSEFIRKSDNVELTTVGIDIGSSTTHLTFSRLHLQRVSNLPTSRFALVKRDVVWRSEIILTPYRSDGTIDNLALGSFIEKAYGAVGLRREQVDSGAVILTGAALERSNSGAIADLFSREAGKFVCASAGHHLECAMAAHGAGAVALSAKRRSTVLNIDIGGGTTKLALVNDGLIDATIAIAVGGRVLVFASDGRVIHASASALAVARELGISVKVGIALRKEERDRIVARLTKVLLDVVAARTLDPLGKTLLLTDYWREAHLLSGIDTVTFSGGIAEFLFDRESRDFGDVGKDLAEHIRQAIAAACIPAEIWDPGEGIRATVTGASQFSVQVSGNTILVPKSDALPLNNLPVIFCRFDLSDTIATEDIEAVVRDALMLADFTEGNGPVALAFQWKGDPSYRRFAALAGGITNALPATIARGHCIVLLVDGDVGLTLGNIVQGIGSAKPQVIAIDGLQLRDFDYVDIGAPILPAKVVPVIIKSLMF